MANTTNFNLYKPNRADNNVDVDTSLADNFTKIDTELQNNKGGLEAHLTEPNAHTSENISHSDGSVKSTLENHELRIGSAENMVTDLGGRVTDIETLGIDKLAPNLDGRISTLESDVEGFLAPATFDAMDQQSYTFDEYRIGYVDNKHGKHFEIVKLVGNEVADDTVAIQEAIDRNALKQAWTIIPEGNYKVTSPLILKEGTRLILHKNARLARYHNDSMFQNGVTGDTLGQSDIVVIGGKLDLRGHILNTDNAMDGSGFVLGYASDIWIKDVEIYNVFYSHGVELCALDNVFVERCGFYGFKVDAGNTRNNVEAIQIERGTSLGFPYFGPGDNTISKNIRIHYCEFGASDVLPSWPTAIGTHQGDTILTADNVEVIGCTTKDTLTYRVTHFRGYKNVTFERNIMQAQTGVTIYDDGVSVSKVRLRNNKITSTVNEAVHVENVDGFSSDGNTLDGYTNALYLKGTKNWKLGESDDYSGQTSDALVSLGSSAYGIANGPTVRKSGRHAFNIYDGSSHIKILNAMILDVSATGSAFNLAGSNTKVVQIRGNHITDTTLTNILAATAGADRVFFNDNFYPASIVTPINSAATNSDTTGNRTF